MTVSPLGDSAVLLAWGESIDPAVTAKVRTITTEIEQHAPSGVVDVVPAFASIAVFFEPTQPAAFEARRAELEALVARAEINSSSVAQRTIDIPVCYGGELGPDLEALANQAQLSAAAFTELHAAADYLVHAIGFAPGFPYLGGLPSCLAAPRRATPRPRVPAGSVGIGGAQTGIYPLETPGGWNLIGCTPQTLFDATRDEPALLRTGDRVKFRAISRDEFQAARAVVQASSGMPTADGPVGGATTHDGIDVLRAGMYTTVQDSGRRGHRAHGVPHSGAVDSFALRLVNLLVGNPETAAALEFTLVGPDLKFLHDSVIAIGGGEFGDLPCWRPIPIRAGTTVKLGPARRGCRGYLAAAGGIDVAPVLNSRSTYARARLGGFHGRALRDGDRLPVPVVQRHVRNHWWIDERILPEYSSAPLVRLVRGGNAGEFDDAWLTTVFKVSTHSDRMGVRLNGPPLKRKVTHELISSPVVPGTVQVPPDGQPILLLADAQTIGGYPQVAHIVSVDLPLVAQLRPGDMVRFQLVTLAMARELIAAQERTFALLREGLAEKLA